jgi:hypothetical protein
VRVERDGHCCFRRDGVVDVGWPGFWRGYATAGYSGRRGGGGPSRRRDDYEERRPREVSPEALLTGKVKASKSAEAILFLVDAHGDDFNFIHVSAAVNTLYKVATPESAKTLTEDERFAKLIDLVRDRCKKFNERNVASVLHGVLRADFGVHAVDVELAEDLVKIAERKARDMKPQAVANTFNALSKLDVAASQMSTSGWGALSRRAEDVAPKMNAQAVANVLNALGKLDAAASQMSTSGWGALARAAEGVAPEMNSEAVANTSHSEREAAAEREASNMTSQGRQMTLSGCKKLGIKIPPAYKQMYGAIRTI